MSSIAALQQPNRVALLKVRVPHNRVQPDEGQTHEDRARAMVRRYLYTGTVVMSTLDDAEPDRIAWVITVLVQDFMKSLESFREYGIQPQIDRIASSGFMRVTESTIYTPEA